MTDRNIRVEPVVGRAVEDQEVEIVERKGLGHPDSICDGIAEAVSKALARTYLERFGEVLHYNTDETQLVAGSAAPAFGGGEVLEPIYLLITGRATKEYQGTKIPAETIALRAARDYLAENFPELDHGTDVIVDVKLGEGSGDLQGVFDDEGRQIPMANDTSFGVGHAPLTETEQVVLETERRLNGRYAEEHPVVGPDIKVMGKREGDRIDVTLAAAIIDSHVGDLADYDDAVAGIREFVGDLAADITDREVRVHVNTADDYDAGSIYLTTTGTSAEQGDDGSVGRGNRSNGLITPNRSMSMEATSGKNPVNHIGKIYNLLSTEIAESVVDEVDGIREIRIRLLSQIGEPIDDPHVADASLVTADGVSVGDIEAEVTRIIDRELADVTSVTERVIEGELSTF
jgi:S-adenosylmethionine synthetase